MSTIVYTLAAEKFRPLPAQIQLLKQHVDDLSRIIVVQGPFGATGGKLDAGDRFISEMTANELGVELWTLDTEGGGWGFIDRVPIIAACVREHSFTQPERFAMLMHSDTLPAQRVNVPALLDGFPFVGRGRRRKGRPYMFETWQAWDSEVPEMQNVHFHLHIVGGVSVKLYDAKCLGKEGHYFEECEPCFLHLNQLMSIPDEMLSEKIDAAAEYLGCELPNYDPSSQLAGELPIFRLRHRFRDHHKLKYGKPQPEKFNAEDKQRASSYLNAVQRWVNGGSKKRGEEIVMATVEKHCKTCDYFTEKGTCRHQHCGLQGNESGLQHVLSPFNQDLPIINKIRMATERCPLWKW
jgi:hypothetical protein